MEKTRETVSHEHAAQTRAMKNVIFMPGANQGEFRGNGAIVLTI